MIVIIAILFILFALVAVLYNRKKTKETIARINTMLEEAIENTFTEESYDESRLSALETKFAHYLSVASSSALNVKADRDRIKTLISDISHQTKTPISNLILYSELLKEIPLPEEAKENVESIHKQAETLRFLIDSLIKLSRLENGILTLEPYENKIMPMLEHIKNRFTADAEAKGLELKIENSDDIAVFDPKWTKEALGNIVDNAIKYTHKGNIIISVQAYELFTRIDIKDTGVGIAEEEIPRIFSRFYRVDKGKEREGVGIGLYLARKIISSEYGYIKVQSDLNLGSTFSVFLPKDSFERKNIKKA